MKNIVKNDDLVGELYIDITESEEQYNSFAYDIERKILRGDGRYCEYGLLGDAEYIDLLADLDSNGIPQTQKYIDLISGVNYTSNSGNNTLFQGIKKMLAYIVFYEYSVFNFYKRNSVATSTANQQNSNALTLEQVQISAADKFNEGIKLYNNECYDYINYYSSNYPNWDFSKKGKILTKGII